MFYKLLILGVVFVFLFFSSDRQKTSATDQVAAFVEQLFQSPTPVESVETPETTKSAEILTPAPEDYVVDELIDLAKKLSPDEIEMVSRMIEFYEYDDLTFALRKIEYRGYENLSTLFSTAVKNNIKSYNELSEITVAIMPAPLTAPAPLTQDGKELVIYQFLNQEGEYTTEKLFTKSVRIYDGKEAKFGIIFSDSNFCYSSDDPPFEIGSAQFEAVFLFSENINNHCYFVIGVTDYKGNRMVTIIENPLFHTYSEESCIVSVDSKTLFVMNDDGTTALYFNDDNDYYKTLNNYRNRVIVADILYKEVDLEKLMEYDEKYGGIDLNEQSKDAYIRDYGIGNLKAQFGAGLMQTIYKAKKIKLIDAYGSIVNFDASKGINDIMCLDVPIQPIIQSYDDIISWLNFPDSIPIATGSMYFRYYVPYTYEY